MAGLTLADIDAAESARAKVRSALHEIGRTLYQMRHGEKLGSEYRFERYSREEFEGSHYSGQDGPDWGAETPIFSLTYYWARAENVRYVTFPQSWLEQDWRALETDRLAAERAAEKKALEAAERDAAERSAIAERETYEQLRAKFEGSK